MSKFLHLTRPGFAQSLSQGHLGIADPVHDLIRCARDDGDDVYSGADVTPKAPRVDDVPGLKSLLTRAACDDYAAIQEIRQLGAPAVRPILRAMADERIEADDGSEAIAAIAKRDDSAVSAVLKQLKLKRNVKLREAASSAIAKLATTQIRKMKFKRTVNALIALLDCGEKNVVMDVATALCRIGDERALEPVTQLLSHPDREVRESVATDLFKSHTRYAVRAFAALAISDDQDVATHMEEILIKRFPQHFEKGAILGQAFKALANLLRHDRREQLRAEMEEKEAAERAERETLEEKMQEIAEEIAHRVALGAGLQSGLRVGTSADDGVYASVSSMGMKQNMQMRFELRQEQLPVGLDIREGEAIEEMRERMRALNYLVPHEMGHRVQDERGISEKTMDVSRYDELDHESIQHNANETFIDKLAFELAANVYVHGDGDLMFDERMREIVFIHSYLTMGGIVYRNHQAERFPLGDEEVARVIAVLRELATNKSITGTVQAELRVLASRFEGGIDESRTNEFHRLVESYSKVFRDSSLEI